MFHIPGGALIGGLGGLALGIAGAHLILYPLNFLHDEGAFRYVSFGLSALCGYSGLLLGARKARDLTVESLVKTFRARSKEEPPRILDTSVIIDGRIAGIIDVGFLEGRFIVPAFILEELQHIADSPDPARRARGRRGLDTLQKIRMLPAADVVISHENPSGAREPDAKLLALARILNGRIITNDFNLHKVARLQEIPVCSINELAVAVRPIALPGETLQVFVAKEGKEPHQGVAYLDDGTMVVIENGRKSLGKGIEAEVTSMLQTAAGKMVFAKAKEGPEKE